VGVGFSCTRRSSGRTMMEKRVASLRTTKVAANVHSAATAPTIA
jgi:hypothetical protein